ncbi:MAG TPA: hypothetical protein PLV68_01590, partial [Ilumatobacteraceae bacterium]|nr:hypothetical protein [Ilumatobacteraceae bacterium]
ARAQVWAEPSAPSARTRIEGTLRGALSAVAGEDGSFAFYGLPTGRYSLRASWPGTAAKARTVALRPPVVAETGARDVRLVLVADGGVRGTVQRNDGVAPAMFTVALGGGAAFGGGSGEFAITGVPAGKHTLRISGLDFATRTIDGLEVKPGQLLDLGRITVVRGRQLTGKVVRADGSPVAGATVTVTNTGAATLSLLGATVGDGRFTIEASTVEVIAVRNAPGVLAAPDAANAVPAWGRDDAFDLFPPAQPPEGIERGDSATLTLARIEAGWPATGAELTEATIPAETGFVVGLAVSFTKGCYPGQELVERMDSRGSSAPRTIRRLRGSGSAAVGDPVVGADGKIVGHLSSVAATADGRGDGWVALVPLARSVEVDADGAATTTLTVGGLPAVVEPANVNTVP